MFKYHTQRSLGTLMSCILFICSFGSDAFQGKEQNFKLATLNFAKIYEA
jgi:hypothetical protein